jgi:hypothetical protein
MEGNCLKCKGELSGFAKGGRCATCIAQGLERKLAAALSPTRDVVPVGGDIVVQFDGSVEACILARGLLLVTMPRPGANAPSRYGRVVFAQVRSDAPAAETPEPSAGDGNGVGAEEVVVVVAAEDEDDDDDDDDDGDGDYHAAQSLVRLLAQVTGGAAQELAVVTPAARFHRERDPADAGDPHQSAGGKNAMLPREDATARGERRYGGGVPARARGAAARPLDRVLLCESAAQVATRILVETCLGRGQVVANLVQPVCNVRLPGGGGDDDESTHQIVGVVRPLRNITAVESTAFLGAHILGPIARDGEHPLLRRWRQRQHRDDTAAAVGDNDDDENSPESGCGNGAVLGVQGLVAAFVTESQREHPAAIANLVRTAEKLVAAPCIVINPEGSQPGEV